MVIPPKRFVGLHAHDGFSTFDGMGLPQEHFDFVMSNTREELDVPALAITNHGHMNSYAHAYLYARELAKGGKKFKFLPGCELYVHPDLAQWRELKASAEDEDIQHGSTVENEEETKSAKHYDPIKRRHHLVVLAKHDKGLENLFATVSRGYIEGFYKFPRVDYSMLKQFKGDFIVSTACIGGPLSYDIYSEFPSATFEELGPQLVDDPNVRERVLVKLENTVDRIVDAVGRENFFLELQFNKLPPQHLTNRLLMELSSRTGIPLVATADSHYCRPDVWQEREIYRKLAWLNWKEYKPEDVPQAVDELKAELYPKNAAQMWAEYKKTGAGFAFYDDQIVADAIERTHDVAFGLIGDVNPDTKVKLPSYVVPKGVTAHDALKAACEDGLKKFKLDGKPEYVQRLQYELGVIGEKKFSEYFLTMKAIVDIASEHMLIGAGRGSAAGSLVNYVLEITQVDPLKYGLIFERFINPLRKDFPDIDSDFADRDKLIYLLKEKFGNLNVLPISNYNTFQLKSLVKDISRFFNIEFGEVNNALAPVDSEVRRKVLKQGDDKNLFELKLEDALEHCQRFSDFMDAHPEVLGPIETLLKENRSLGKHAGGVIVAEDIVQRMPVIMSKKELQTPFVEGMHYKHLNELGWIKFDLLGLETLRIIERCIELILQRHHGNARPTFKDVKAWYKEHLHPDVIDLNEQKVYEHIYCSGRWAGVFQFTAKGAQLFCERAQPKNIIDIAAITSIYRPGPLVAGVDRDYVAAKNDPDNVHYDHPLIKEVLGETFGFLVFQEQMLRLGNVVGKMPLAKCDRLRKVITKRSMSEKGKAASEAEQLGEEFIAGAKENGFSEKKAVELWDNMAAFKGYAFNLSHALSYAIDSYQCAWLLTHYEAEWLCAYMETQAGQPEKRAKAIGELKSFGYEIVKVDVNHATDQWTIMPGKKFMPSFLTVKAVGDKAVEEIEMYRPYRMVEDLLWNPDGTWRHSKFNKRAMENLIKIGAFESMGIVGEGKPFASYRAMHAVIVEDNHKLKHKKKGRDELAARLKALGSLDEWSKEERIAFSKELVGAFDINLVMPKKVRDKLDELNLLSIDDFDPDRRPAIYWFIVEETQVKLTKNKKEYILLTATGLSGKRSKIYCWGFNSEKHDVAANQVYVGELGQTNFGFSTQVFKIKSVGQRKNAA